MIGPSAPSRQVSPDTIFIYARLGLSKDPVLRKKKLVFGLTQRLGAFGPFTQDCFRCIWPDLADLSGNSRNDEHDHIPVAMLKLS